MAVRGPSADGTDEVVRDLVALRRDIGGGGEAVDVEHEEIGEPISDPFDPEQIDVITRTPTVNLILSRIRKGAIDLAPDFQRHAGIWKDVNQSRLIESLLLRIPLPTFYAAENPDDSWSIVDGIQRLTAITRFMAPETTSLPPLVLQKLDYLDLNGRRFDDLPGRLQTRLDETEIVLHLIRQGTPEPVKFNIFARINTGGVPLSQQELRHALIPGPARALLATLAQSGAFVRATGGTVSASRMADREMVLRFMAFFIAGPDRYRTDDFDLFLRDAMRQINQMTSVERDRLAALFLGVMGAAESIFGIYAFRKQYQTEAARYPVNKALFEAISVALAKYDPAQTTVLTARRQRLNREFVRIMNEDADFERAISVGTGSVAKVRHRFAIVTTLFDSTLEG